MTGYGLLELISCANCPSNIVKLAPHREVGKEIPSTYVLDKEEVIIGRDPSQGLYLPFAPISRVHCAIWSSVSEDGNSASVSLVDKSSNGTFVNGRRAEKGFETALKHDDVLTFYAPPDESLPRIDYKVRLWERERWPPCNSAQRINKRETNDPAELRSQLEYSEPAFGSMKVACDMHKFDKAGLIACSIEAAENENELQARADRTAAQIEDARRHLHRVQEESRMLQVQLEEKSRQLGQAVVARARYEQLEAEARAQAKSHDELRRAAEAELAEASKLTAQLECRVQTVDQRFADAAAAAAASMLEYTARNDLTEQNRDLSENLEAMEVSYVNAAKDLRDCQDELSLAQVSKRQLELDCAKIVARCEGLEGELRAREHDLKVLCRDLEAQHKVNAALEAQSCLCGTMSRQMKADFDRSYSRLQEGLTQLKKSQSLEDSNGASRFGPLQSEVDLGDDDETKTQTGPPLAVVLADQPSSLPAAGTCDQADPAPGLDEQPVHSHEYKDSNHAPSSTAIDDNQRNEDGAQMSQPATKRQRTE